jgi:hypothetical protein
MTRGAERSIHHGATLQVSGSFRCIGWRVGAGEKTRLSPGTDPANQDVDLFVGEHSASGLRKGGHRSSMYSIGSGAANRGIVSDRQENGVPQSDRRSSVTAGAVASRTVLSEEAVELYNLIRRDDIGAWSRASR